MLRNVFLGLACTAALASPAWAHFIWLDLQPAAGGQGHARLYFSEEPAPGEAELIGKAAKAKVLAPPGRRHHLGGEAEPKRFGSPRCKPTVPPAVPASRASGTTASTRAVRSLVRCCSTMPRVSRTIGCRNAKLARAEKLKLDIVPSLSEKKLAVQVLYDGKPVKDSEVLFVDPDGEYHELTTDSEGRAQIDAAAGQWGCAHRQDRRRSERRARRQEVQPGVALCHAHGRRARQHADSREDQRRLGRSTYWSGLATAGPSGTTSPASRPT